MPLGPGVFREGEVADPEALGQAIKELFNREKLSRDVRVGIANQRVAVRSMRLPAIDNRDELETAIRFQAQDHIPMPLDQSVLDWQVVGHSTDENGERKVEVVAVAARRDMIAQLLEALSIAGRAADRHRPFRFRHDPRACPRGRLSRRPWPVRVRPVIRGAGRQPMRAAPRPSRWPRTTPRAKLFCNLGDVTNLAVARGSSCLFTRIASFGVEGIAQKLAERRRLTVEHSRQWLTHVGLEQPVEAIEGDPEHVAGRSRVPCRRRRAARGRASGFDGLLLGHDGAVPIEGVVVCGPGTRIPGMVERLQRSLGHAFSVAKPTPLGHLDDAAAVRQTLSYGLALEQ